MAGGFAVGSFENQYSGATVRDSHPLPYSPRTAVRGTRSHITVSRDQSFRISKLSRDFARRQTSVMPDFAEPALASHGIKAMMGQRKSRRNR
jgi:hypothetical protein